MRVASTTGGSFRLGGASSNSSTSSGSDDLGIDVVVGLGDVGLTDRRLVDRAAVLGESRGAGRGTRSLGLRASPPVIATVRPPIVTNHRKTAGPNVVWSTPTWPKFPSWPPPA